jgi:hypothetical protein
VLAVIPALIAFIAVFLPLSYLGQRLVAGAVASLASALALGLEAALAVFILGKVFEKFDLSAET